MSTILEPAGRLVRSHAFTAPIEWRDSGNGTDFTLRGYAAKFDQPSDDLGGFREILAPAAFRGALAATPDTRLLFNHDANYVMARTKAGTLELREDDVGLQVWARVSKDIGWISDLRKSMERGDIDQMSFAFTINEGGDDWAVAEDGTVVRTIRSDGVQGLFDVSVVTYPAYPQTEASMRSALEDAVVRGRIPGWAAPENPAQATDPVEDSRTASRLAAFRLRRERVANANPQIQE